MSRRDQNARASTDGRETSETTQARLAEIVEDLEQVDAHATALRAERNNLLYLAMTKEGSTERAAALLGKVSPTYAHRIRTHAGNPPSRPKVDERQRTATA